MTTRTVYRISNGDDSLLATDSAGATTVTHRVKLSSDGKDTILPVEELLERGGGSPEPHAVRTALAEMPTDIESDVDEASAVGLVYLDDLDHLDDPTG